MLARATRFFSPPDESSVRCRLFWVAFAARVLYLTLAHTYRIRLTDDHFQFGWEMGRIARALATGRGYADPFTGHSGPTAWTPPLYPMLLAAFFKFCGVYTLTSAWLILALNSLFSAATAPAIYEIARRAFAPDLTRPGVPNTRNLALWSGWLWALYPAFLQYAVRWVWDMSLTACLFAWVLVLALRLRTLDAGAPCRTVPPSGADLGAPSQTVLSSAFESISSTLDPWLCFGLFWALIALANSSLLLFLPACTLWILWPTLRTRHHLAPTLQKAAVAAAVFLAVISPWIVRNALAFHAFVPMRSNFGAELFESAQLSNYGFPEMATLPLAESSPQFKRYQRLGEIAYSKQQGSRAAAIIRAHPGLFLQNALRRVYFFWVSVPHPSPDNKPFTAFPDPVELGRVLSYAFLSLGGLLGLALTIYRRLPAASLFAWAFATLPLIYYFITVQARFRHPLEPLICILTVYLFQSADRTRTWSRQTHPA